jgi:hypothetical protein
MSTLFLTSSDFRFLPSEILASSDLLPVTCLAATGDVLNTLSPSFVLHWCARRLARRRSMLFLDDNMQHTSQRTRARSPFLLSTICFCVLRSPSYRLSDSATVPAEKMEAVADIVTKHTNALFSSGRKSLEDCQALLLLTAYADIHSAFESDRTWMMLGLVRDLPSLSASFFLSASDLLVSNSSAYACHSNWCLSAAGQLVALLLIIESRISRDLQESVCHRLPLS